MNTRRRAIVSAVIRMAHGLELRVTAEGVETEEQLAYLREQGCEEVQGFLFGRPKPAGERAGSILDIAYFRPVGAS